MWPTLFPSPITIQSSVTRWPDGLAIFNDENWPTGTNKLPAYGKFLPNTKNTFIFLLKALKFAKVAKFRQIWSHSIAKSH